MDAPQYDKRELREALPLAATPSPASTPSSNPDSKTGAVPAKRFEMPSAAEVDELRLGFVPTVNPLQALAEMKSAAAAPPPSPAPPPAAAAHVYSPAFAPSGSSALRGASPYFASNAPVAPAKKRPLIINANQKGNLLMKYIKNAPYEFATDLGPDFVFTPSACGFYLSMRYHMLNKPYVAGRVQEVKAYALRVVLCHVDSTDDSAAAIRELSQQCLGLNVTLILAWSYKEVARYVETFKQYEGRPATMLQERVEESEKFADVLQVVRFVNKTDVQTLAHSFGTLRRIANASMEELSLCPGLGARKVQKLHAAFTDPLDPAVGRKKQKATEISSFLTRAPPSEDVVSERSSER